MRGGTSRQIGFTNSMPRPATQYPRTRKSDRNGTENRDKVIDIGATWSRKAHYPRKNYDTHQRLFSAGGRDRPLVKTVKPMSRGFNILSGARQ